MREIRFVARAILNPYAWAALVLSLVLLAAAYQLPFRFDLALGTPQAAPYLSNFYPQQAIESRAARWSAAFAYVRLPGTGGNRPLRLQVDLNPSRLGVTNPKPPTVVLIVGGEQLYSRTLDPTSGWQTITLDVDQSHPTALSARDLVLELRTDVYRPPDYQGTELGVAVSNITVEPLPGAPWRPVVPNVRVMLLAAILLAAVYLLAARASSGRGASRHLPRWFAAVVLLFGLLLALGIVLNPVFVSLNLTLWLAIALGLYALLLAGFYLLPRLWPYLRAEGRTLHAALNYPSLLGLLIVTPVLFSLGFQSSLDYTIDVGSGRDTPFIQGFNPPMFPLPDGSPGDYRYTSQRALITLPGAGSDNLYMVTMRINPGSGPASRSQVQIVANGSLVQSLQLSQGWQDVSFTASTGPSRVFEGSDLAIEIKAPAEVIEGGEQRGVMVDTVRIEQVSGAGLFSRSPAHEAGLLFGVLLLYVLVCRAYGSVPPLHIRRLALVCAGLAVLVLAWLLIDSRVEVAVALPQLLTTLLSGYLLIVITSHLFPRWPALVPALFSAAFMLRFGYSALPQMNVIDLPYHLGWLRRLIGGDFAALYFPGQLSSVPPEWNLDVLIPKSPLFYMAVWPLGLLKGIDLGPAVLLIVSLVDALLVPALFALLSPLSRRAGLWAAGTYVVLPLAFRALSFGVLPTIFAQALTLFVMLWPTLRPYSLRRPLFFGLWTLLLTASLIAFPTALAFNSPVLVLLAVGWRAREAAPLGTYLRLLGGLALALALSVVLYYGLYIPQFFSRTLPALAGGTSLGGKELWPGGPLEMIGWTGGYLVNWLPYLLIPIALLMLWLPGTRFSKRMAVLLLAWLVVLVAGMLLNLRFDMIGKHLYYTMPAACAAFGLVASGLWRMLPARPYSRALAALSAISIFWFTLAFITTRL